MGLSLPPVPLFEKTFGNSWVKWLVKLRDLLIYGENVQTPTLLNSWVNYGSGYHNAGYWKDISGRVHIRGVISGGVPGATSVAFVLPENYRPESSEIFASAGNLAFAQVNVQENGNVIIRVGSTTYTSISGISFRTKDNA